MFCLAVVGNTSCVIFTLWESLTLRSLPSCYFYKYIKLLKHLWNRAINIIMIVFIPSDSNIILCNKGALSPRTEGVARPKQTGMRATLDAYNNNFDLRFFYDCMQTYYRTIDTLISILFSKIWDYIRFKTTSLF